jgi:hypothetical protein
MCGDIQEHHTFCILVYLNVFGFCV